MFKVELEWTTSDGRSVTDTREKDSIEDVYAFLKKVDFRSDVTVLVWKEGKDEA